MMTTIPRAADIPHTESSRGVLVADRQHAALLAEASRLTADQWELPTDCTRWSVGDIVRHVTAFLVQAASPVAYAGNLLRGRLRYPDESLLDAMNEVGIDRRRDWSPEHVLADFARLMPKAHFPRLLHRIPIKDPMLPPYATVAWLDAVLFPRDTWLHRHDIAKATGLAVVPDPTDADVVAQAVRDLGLAWSGPSVVLELVGTEGGTWLLGSDDSAPIARLDAIEFMRHLSGRPTSGQLFADTPDAVRPALDAARVIF